jgi:nicotinamide-nucleotide amidase
MNEDLLEAARQAGAWLHLHGLLLATAESCTGGLIATAITEIAGCSAWFERGFVTYTNDSKQELLGVQTATLAAFGAVSEQTVREMALGALIHSAADVAVATSGIAGPSGGTPEKPVGTVCFSWARRAQGKNTVHHVTSCTLLFDGDRAAIRQQAALLAIKEIVAKV